MFEAEQAKHAAKCSSLQAKLLSAEQRQEDLRIALETSSSQMTSMQQQEQQVRQQLADSQALHAELASSRAALQARCSVVEAQLASTQSDSSKFQNQASSTTQPDSAAVLQLLEQQLVSLSHMLREKEQQIGALQETVQQQCDERTLMHIKYMHLTSAHQTESLGTASGNSPDQSVVTSSHTAQTARASDGSMSHSNLLSSQMSAGKHVPDKAEAPAQSRGSFNRLASASEQQHGKSGLLGRIMATSSKTGRTV